jgi:hypothetical protein
MAITKTTNLHDITIFPATETGDSTLNSNHPRILVEYEDTLDDLEDSDLPITVSRNKTLTKFVADGGAATDVSGEDALVQAIAGGIWS